MHFKGHMKKINLRIKKAQRELLKAFSKEAKGFALAGGTALELFYLHHRFSADLDFFSPKYNISEIEQIISGLKKFIEGKGKVKLESEFLLEGRANVRFYNVTIKGLDNAIKLDFVEDVIITKPTINRFNGIPVYSARDIYMQKLTAIAGTRIEVDEVGRQIIHGRRQARDAFDVYMLSKKIRPLHIFLKGMPGQIQKGIVRWYQTFSRQDLKLGLLDLDIYDKKFDSKKMIVYLEGQIKKFIEEVIEG